uniref:Importin subunit alpha n=1 Tax=Rhabditophanes sp. KR3021 TaxID=114890 RepID=A0AC35U1A4_9BILA
MSGLDRNRLAGGEERARMKQYKNNSKHEDSRRRRTECSVELRKQKRDDDMMKRRNVVLEEDAEEGQDCFKNEDSEVKRVEQPGSVVIAEAVRVLSNSPDLAQMLVTFESVRRLLSKSKDPPVEEIVKSGLLNALTEGLTIQHEKIQFECAWAITNVVSGDTSQTIEAVKTGCTPRLLALCRTGKLNLIEQALWAIANITGDSSQLRDYAISEGLLEVLTDLIKNAHTTKVELVRVMAWTLSNLCRHKNPHPSPMAIKKILPNIHILMEHQDKAVRQDACWALSYMSDGPDEQIALVASEKTLQILLDMLKSKVDSWVAPALRVFGNIATGADFLTQYVVDCGALNVLPSLMEKKKATIIKECAWLISNIAAGSQGQIQAIIESKCLEHVFQTFYNGDHKSIFECSWVVSNIVQGGTTNQILALREYGGIAALCSQLNAPNAEVTVNILDTLKGILDASRSVSDQVLAKTTTEIEECNGLDKIEALQQQENDNIYKSSYEIISEFFNTGDDDFDNDESKENEMDRFNF